MKLTTLSTLVMISGSVAWAQDAVQPVSPPAKPAPAAEADTAKAQIETATQAFDKQSKEFMEKLRAEKDRKKQMEMYKSGRPNPTEAVNLILKLAKENPKADGVENGLGWCVRYSNPTQRKEVCNLLLTHYKDSKAIGSMASNYGRMRSGGEAELRAISEKAGDAKVRQGASYYLASRLTKKADTKAEGLAMMKKLIATPGIDKSNPKLVAQMKGEIMVAEKLGIGCTAPDIVGTDQEDKEFKLSDYRGQVVLLDFWGIW